MAALPHRRARSTCVAAGMLAVAFSTAGASIQDPINETRISTAVVVNRSGEIDYSFDTTSNITQVRYRSALGPRNFLRRLFSDTPLHTLIVTYHLGGRASGHRPDTVSLLFISDEDRASPVGDLSVSLHPRMLTIDTGDSVLYYPLSVSERRESFTQTAAGPPQLSEMRFNSIGVNAMAAKNGVHINRLARASVPICEFIAFINGRHVRGTVDGVDFQLPDDVLAGLRRFAADMGPNR